MAIRDVGEMEIDSINDMNIPVVCFLSAPEGDNGCWEWTARNFMPRKEFCGGSWNVQADTKEELLEFVREKVVPLYRVAMENLEKFGENYYWESKEGAM